jgi:hypothetical protein
MSEKKWCPEDGEEVKCEECQNRGNKKNSLEYHHIIYRSNGGSDDRSNLQILCKRCHRKFHQQAGDFSEFGRKGGAIRQHRLRVQLGDEGYSRLQRKYALIRWEKWRREKFRKAEVRAIKVIS